MNKIIYILTIFLLFGCASTARIVNYDPVEIIQPTEGYSALYIFRPELDRINRRDKPSLIIDNMHIADLPFASYTRIELPVGKHQLALAAKKSESKIWNTATEFEITQPGIYFIAIWNPNQPGRSSTVVPVFIPGYLLFVPVTGLRRGAKSGVEFESVTQEVGESALMGLTYIKGESTRD